MLGHTFGEILVSVFLWLPGILLMHSLCLKLSCQLDLGAHSFNPSTRVMGRETDRSVWVWDYPDLYNKFQGTQGCIDIVSKWTKKQTKNLLCLHLCLCFSRETLNYSVGQIPSWNWHFHLFSVLSGPTFTHLQTQMETLFLLIGLWDRGLELDAWENQFRTEGSHLRRRIQ